MFGIDLNKHLAKIKKGNNGKVLSLLEKLGISYECLDTKEYGYFRVRVVIDSNLKNYAFTDIWYSKYYGCYISTDYWQET